MLPCRRLKSHTFALSLSLQKTERIHSSGTMFLPEHYSVYKVYYPPLC
jgi:hypothetical protein